MENFKSISKELNGEFQVAAAMDVAFPLFSPAGEREWVPGWSPELIHPPGAVWAQGQIFRTQEEKGEAIWLVNHLDAAAHRVEYHRVEPGRYVARVRVQCRVAGERATQVSVSYTFIGLSESGNDEIRAMTDEAYQQKMARWKKWIGECLARR